MSFSIKQNYVIETNHTWDDNIMMEFFKNIDNYNNSYIIVPSIYHYNINNKRINGYSYFIFNIENNPFLHNGYTFYEDKFKLHLNDKDYIYTQGNIHKNKVIKLIQEIKSLNIKECLKYFNTYFYTQDFVFHSLKKKIDEEFLILEKEYNLHSYTIGYILKYINIVDEYMYKLLYDLLAGSNIISTKYIKIK